jgi:hypothetical protein
MNGISVIVFALRQPLPDASRRRELRAGTLPPGPLSHHRQRHETLLKARTVRDRRTLEMPPVLIGFKWCCPV